MKLFRRLQIPIFFLLALSACQYKLEKLGAPDRLDAQAEVFSNNQLDYELIRNRVLIPKCLDCHSADKVIRGKVNLDSYEGVLANLADVRATITSGEMPKADSLSAQQKDLILRWIDLGAPEVPSLEMPTPVPPAPEPSTPPTTPSPAPPSSGPEPLDFETINRRVITPSCLKCHSDRPDGKGNKGDVNLESYPAVLKNIKLVESTIADDSMPKRATLDPKDKALILRWITEGALEKGLPGSVVEAERKMMTQNLTEFIQTEENSK